MNCAHARTHAESFSVFRLILKPTCNFSLLYTVSKSRRFLIRINAFLRRRRKKAWDGKKLRIELSHRYDTCSKVNPGRDMSNIATAHTHICGSKFCLNSILSLLWWIRSFFDKGTGCSSIALKRREGRILRFSVSGGWWWFFRIQGFCEAEQIREGRHVFFDRGPQNR